MKKYIWNILIAFDQFMNVLLSPILNLLIVKGGAKFGSPDETLSSVFGKNYKQKTCFGCIIMCRILNFFEKEHCIKSIELDEGEKK